MKILIVDDEQLARDRIKDLIRRSGAKHSLLEAGNGLAALEIARGESPDAVLLDIRMPGMDGLETADHLARLDRPPAIIFTTAYDDRALEAFEASAVDYLLKPVRSERLIRALDRARILGASHIRKLREHDPARRPRTYISVSGHDGIQLVPVAEIRYLKADQKYVCIGWPGRELLLDEPLKSLEQEFGDRFLRIHRNALVARHLLESLDKRVGGAFELRLRGVAQPFAVSRRHAGDVRKALKGSVLGLEGVRPRAP